MIRYTLSVLEMWSFTVYFTVNRRSLIHPIPAQRSLFPLESYSKKTLKKMPRRALVNTKRNVLMPPGHPIILLKSNLFNLAAVSVKWSIAVCINLLQVCPSGPHLLWYLCILFMSGAVFFYVLLSLVAVLIVSMLLNLLTHQKTRTRRKHAVCSLKNCLQCLIYQPYVVHLLNNLKVF